MPAEIVLAARTVPRTGVKIEIAVRYADFRLAELLGDRPGTGLWVARYSVTRHVGERMAFGNYLSFSRQGLDEAREIANELWTDSVQRRDANGA